LQSGASSGTTSCVNLAAIFPIYLPDENASLDDLKYLGPTRCDDETYYNFI